MSSAADSSREPPPKPPKKKFWTRELMPATNRPAVYGYLVGVVAAGILFMGFAKGEEKVLYRAARQATDFKLKQLRSYQDCTKHTGDKKACYIAVYFPSECK